MQKSTEKTVLFVCIHNSARSQMAEAFANELGKGRIKAYSAGLEPGKLNPYVVKLMNESGTDISGNRTKSVDEFLKERKEFDYVITVCDEASGERCPLFPGGGKKMHWNIEDPSQVKGTEEEKMNKIRAIRDEIKQRVKQFLEDEVG